MSALVRVENRSQGVNLADRGSLATGPIQRFRGLMLKRREEFDQGSALIIDPCSSIHMFFMRFPIDVLYLDRNDTVVAVQESLRPWRVGRLYTKGAKYVIELPEGSVQKSGTAPGDEIQIIVRDQDGR